MNEYGDIGEMWEAALESVMAGSTCAAHGDPTLERVGWAGRLLNPDRATLLSPTRRFDPAYASAELLWYLSGEKSVARMLPYAPQYGKFAGPDGDADGYAYGWRFENNPGFEMATRTADGWGFADQFDALVELLVKHPDTRQGVVTVYDSGDLVNAINGESWRVPCTICLNFNLRHGRLHLGAYMRSNDVWLGLPYDVWCFTAIQRVVAARVGADLGHYCHHVGSLHVYERDVRKLAAPCGALDVEIEESPPDGMPVVWSRDRLQVVLHAERQGRVEGKRVITPGGDDLLGQAALCCLRRTCKKDHRVGPSNPVLRRAFEIKEVKKKN